MADITSGLRDFVDGKDVNSFGLHLICTPDTRGLTEKVRNQIQALLDKARENDAQGVRNENVTIEYIEDYDSFACGESISTLKESVRGKHVYLFSDPSGDYIPNKEREVLEKLKAFGIENSMDRSLLKTIEQGISKGLNHKLIHDLLLLASISDNGASSVNLVQPCIPYARQDKTTPDKRQSASIDILGEWISNITEKNGYCINIDLHNPASRGAFKGTNFIDLYTGWLIDEVMKKEGLRRADTTISPADQGGMKSISAIAKQYELRNIVVVKDRDYSIKNSVDDIDIYGNVEGQHVIISDDMLDTGGTMASLLREMLKKNPKSIRVIITHAMLNGPAKERLAQVISESNGVIKKIYTTDSINKQNLPDFIEVISLDKILANTITSIYKGLGIDRGDNTDYTKMV